MGLLTTTKQRMPVLGSLVKGAPRGNFGKSATLKELPYFRFKPAFRDAEMQQAFQAVYGKEPTKIPDIRLPYTTAGEFSILDCAWLFAVQHNQYGSLLLAKADSQRVINMRNSRTGRMETVDGVSLASVTVPDERGGYGNFKYKEAVVPWRPNFSADVILPDFNNYLIKNGISPGGVVILRSSSITDIHRLTAEYQAMINEVASATGKDRSEIPLRMMPICLWRQEEKQITVVNGAPMTNVRYFLHWQLATKFQEELNRVLGLGTNQLLSPPSSDDDMIDGELEL